MTTDEKAKAYDEALKKIQPLYEQAKKDGNPIWSTYEHLFPQLRESEDENLKNKSGYYKAGKFWKASTLWNAVNGKSSQRVPNRYILQECTWNISSLRHFADEVKNVQEVDLNYPIILDMNGNILDGAHRVVKAYLEGKDIDIVYLGDDEWPEPDYDEEKAVKESEDERIRKGIRCYVEDMPDTYGFAHGIGKADMLAWLEKQKETLHISETCKENADSFTDACKDVIVAIEKYLDWLTGYPDYAPKGKYSLRDMLYCLSLLEKQKEQSLRDFIDDFPYSDQKEQKPRIEICPHSIKSKSYRENGYPIENCDYGLEIACDILEKTFGEVRGYQTDDGIREHQTAIEAVRKAKERKPVQKEEEREYIKTLKGIISDFVRDNYKTTDISFYQKIYDWLDGRHIEQKPTERATMRDFNYHEGEPDEKAWSRLFAILNYAEATSDDMPGEEIQALTNWIEGKQKPTWSEEDKLNLNWVIAILNGEPCDLDIQLESLISWLKSLRPSWKPSEEQMEALENSTALTEEQGEALYSLVCDLKKLCQ